MPDIICDLFLLCYVVQITILSFTGILYLLYSLVFYFKGTCYC